VEVKKPIGEGMVAWEGMKPPKPPCSLAFEHVLIKKIMYFSRAKKYIQFYKLGLDKIISPFERNLCPQINILTIYIVVKEKKRKGK